MIWEWPDSTIVRVIDGDTVIARLTRDIGFHGTTTFEQRLRLNRTNAAPIKTNEGIAAAAVLAAMVAGTVRIVTTGAYKYRDEWMAELYDVTGANVNDRMVADGAAVYWDGHGPRPGG